MAANRRKSPRRRPEKDLSDHQLDIFADALLVFCIVMLAVGIAGHVLQLHGSAIVLH